jgi:hypothetical protein
LQDFHPIDFGSKNNTHNVTIVEQKVLPVRLTNWNQLPRIEELHNTQCNFILIAVVQIPHEPQHADFAEAAVELVAGSGLLIFRVWGCTTEAYVKQNLQYRSAFQLKVQENKSYLSFGVSFCKSLLYVSGY